jgi:hypothetical protein
MSPWLVTGITSLCVDNIRTSQETPTVHLGLLQGSLYFTSARVRPAPKVEIELVNCCLGIRFRYTSNVFIIQLEKCVQLLSRPSGQEGMSR